MSTPQCPINSGFNADSTIADVLEGVDLTGKLAIVTGGYSCIGTAVTRGLSEAGVTVVVPARRPGQARKVIGRIERVEVDEIDLADLESVARIADRFLGSDRQIDMLINNAAVVANELTRVGPAGW
jgi:NAD(P)-dependent dehydrogenase (short-subunit alcohol dehydrogenase family)